MILLIIGAELREIQRQINHLENPVDPHEVFENRVVRKNVISDV